MKTRPFRDMQYGIIDYSCGPWRSVASTEGEEGSCSSTFPLVFWKPPTTWHRSWSQSPGGPSMGPFPPTPHLQSLSCLLLHTTLNNAAWPLQCVPDSPHQHQDGHFSPHHITLNLATQQWRGGEFFLMEMLRLSQQGIAENMGYFGLVIHPLHMLLCADDNMVSVATPWDLPCVT